MESRTFEIIRQICEVLFFYCQLYKFFPKVMKRYDYAADKYKKIGYIRVLEKIRILKDNCMPYGNSRLKEYTLFKKNSY